MFTKVISFVLVSSFITTCAFAKGYNCRVESNAKTNLFDIRNVTVSDLSNSSKTVKVEMSFGSKLVSYTSTKDSIQIADPYGKSPNIVFPDMAVHFRTNQDIGYSHQLLINKKNPEKSLLRLNRELLENEDPSEDPYLAPFNTRMNCR